MDDIEIEGMFNSRLLEDSKILKDGITWPLLRSHLALQMTGALDKIQLLLGKGCTMYCWSRRILDRGDC